MTLSKVLLISATILTLISSTAFATTIVLTFDASQACGVPCSNGAFIDQTYGDVLGVVDVTYTGRTGPGNTGATQGSLFFWDIGYAGLTDVVWTQSGGTGEIAFTPSIPGTLITFNSLDLGSFGGPDRTTRVDIFDLAYNLIVSVDPILVGATPFHYAPSGISSSNGLIVQFGPDAFNVGLDNLSVTIGEIVPAPEPASLLLIGVGVAAVGLRRRRR